MITSDPPFIFTLYKRAKWITLAIYKRVTSSNIQLGTTVLMPSRVFCFVAIWLTCVVAVTYCTVDSSSTSQTNKKYVFSQLTEPSNLLRRLRRASGNADKQHPHQRRSMTCNRRKCVVFDPDVTFDSWGGKRSDDDAAAMGTGRRRNDDVDIAEEFFSRYDNSFSDATSRHIQEDGHVVNPYNFDPREFMRDGKHLRKRK
ncbi:Uncharacterised protein r2_g1625 [Pycnogonum litorale]